MTIHGVSEEQIRRNLSAAYYYATERQRRDGMRWYFKAYQEVEKLAGIGRIQRGAEVLAILSPKCPWEVNLAALECIILGLGGCPAPCLPRQFAVATRHWHDGGSPPTTLKCSNFALCVRTQGAEGLCLDTHALNVALGRRATSLELGRHFSNRYTGVVGAGKTGAYDALAKIYRDLAKLHYMSAAQYQAVVWLVQRDGGVPCETR